MPCRNNTQGGDGATDEAKHMGRTCPVLLRASEFACLPAGTAAGALCSNLKASEHAIMPGAAAVSS